MFITRLGHGQFMEWIEREFAWSQRAAYRFMEVHEHVKVANLASLEIDASALYLIAAPSTPEPVRVLRGVGRRPRHQIIGGDFTRRSPVALPFVLTKRVQPKALNPAPPARVLPKRPTAAMVFSPM